MPIKKTKKAGRIEKPKPKQRPTPKPKPKPKPRPKPKPKPADYKGFGSEVDRKRTEAFKEQLPRLIENLEGKKFTPYLVVRTQVGDHGGRPITTERTPPLSVTSARMILNSPDVWIAHGTPGTTPENPGAQGGDASIGQEHTVYAHVWNLGRAPIAGVQVEFYWSTDNPLIDPWYCAYPDDAWLNDFETSKNVQLIGVARVDLAPRSSKKCHALVKCPKAWIPPARGCYRLTVRVSCIGDSIGTTAPWQPRHNRHAAARRIWART
jgi:hypothetical protein